MEIVSIDSAHLASVFLGYDIDTGWRSQPEIALSIRYSDWVNFNSKLSGLRVNQSELDQIGFMKDLATAQYNEVLYSSSRKLDGTLLLPGEGDKYSLSEFNKASLDLWNNGYLKQKVPEVVARLARVNELTGSQYTLTMQYSRLSEWNKKLLRYSLSYMFFNETINLNY